MCAFDAKEHVVIDPFCNGSHPLGSKNLSSNVADDAITATSESQPEAVHRVNGKRVWLLGSDNQHRPLFRSDQDHSVCFFNVTNHSL